MSAIAERQPRICVVIDIEQWIPGATRVTARITAGEIAQAVLVPGATCFDGPGCEVFVVQDCVARERDVRAIRLQSPDLANPGCTSAPCAASLAGAVARTLNAG